MDGVLGSVKRARLGGIEGSNVQAHETVVLPWANSPDRSAPNREFR